VWQAARKGITPIELATLKKKEKKEQTKLVYISTNYNLIKRRKRLATTLLYIFIYMKELTDVS